MPADPSLADAVQAFTGAHPGVVVEPAAEEQLDEMLAEHARASATVELSHAEDAELELELGGELHPFQRAGVRYALERGARSSPTSRASARPCRRWRRWRPTTRSRRWWSARRR